MHPSAAQPLAVLADIEAVSAPAAVVGTAFNANDRNHDGVITRSEVPTASTLDKAVRPK